MTIEVSLFPLHTVLFPGGHLALQIFEPRYLDMIGACLKNDSDFGVAAIRSGSEAGDAALSYGHGTLARIIEWKTLENGLLGISVEGRQRFEILEQCVSATNLITATVKPLDEVNVPVPKAGYERIRSLLERALRIENASSTKPNDAAWVGYRLSEIIPFDNGTKTELLAMTDPLHRLDRLETLLAGLDPVH